MCFLSLSLQWAYHTPGAASASTSFGEVTWFEDPEDASDIYHCSSACSCSSYCGDGSSSSTPCAGPFGTSNGGFLYITITGLGKDDPVAEVNGMEMGEVTLHASSEPVPEATVKAVEVPPPGPPPDYQGTPNPVRAEGEMI